jgi:hypothetical protein
MNVTLSRAHGPAPPSELKSQPLFETEICDSRRDHDSCGLLSNAAQTRGPGRRRAFGFETGLTLKERFHWTGGVSRNLPFSRRSIRLDIPYRMLELGKRGGRNLVRAWIAFS